MIKIYSTPQGLSPLEKPFTADEHSVMWDGRDTRYNASSDGIAPYRIMTDTCLESAQETLVK
ncbi:MAG: hypothetical protein AB1483_13035 [Candidatus Zixiibacteriota bacterium]